MFDPTQVTHIEHSTFATNDFHKVNIFTWLWNIRTIGLLPRICTTATFKTMAGKEFHVYNTHLDHKFEQARAAQLQVIMKHIAEHTQDAPTFLMGDFNQEWDNALQVSTSPLMNTITAAQEKTGPTATRTLAGGKKPVAIDHILMQPNNVKVVKHTVIEELPGTYPSDHRPVMALLEVD